MEAERDTVDRYVAAFLADQVGQIVRCRITGVQPFGFFATVVELGGDGLVLAKDLGREYFRFDEAARQLVGEESGETYKVGQRLTLRLAEANPVSGSLRFELAEDGADTPDDPVEDDETRGHVQLLDQVRVDVGATMTINGAMEIDAVSEAVTVVSDAPVIDLQATTVGVNWDEKQMEDLPYGRGIRGLARLLPGLSPSQFDVGGNTVGGSTTTGARKLGKRASSRQAAIDASASASTQSKRSRRRARTPARRQGNRPLAGDGSGADAGEGPA